MANKNENKKYHYLYKTTNLINNKYYYGMHSTNNLNDNYIGSGSYLRNAIHKYGKDNFKREIIKMFDTREELVKGEIELITIELLNQDLCMNLKPGGSGGFNNLEHQLKCTNAANLKNLNNKYYKDKVTVKDKHGNTFCVCINDPRYLSGELIHVAKNTITAKDKNNNILIINIYDSRYLNGELVGATKGKKHKKETKGKISNSMKEKQKGDKNSQFGTCWITKKGENKKIKKEELQSFINQGWNKGRKLKS